MNRTSVHPGQCVQVDLSGLRADDVAIGGGVSAVGRVVDVDASEMMITVDLGVSIGGHNRVAVAPSRVVAVDDAVAPAASPVAPDFTVPA